MISPKPPPPARGRVGEGGRLWSGAFSWQHDQSLHDSELRGGAALHHARHVSADAKPAEPDLPYRGRRAGRHGRLSPRRGDGRQCFHSRRFRALGTTVTWRRNPGPHALVLAHAAPAPRPTPPVSPTLCATHR